MNKIANHFKNHIFHSVFLGVFIGVMISVIIFVMAPIMSKWESTTVLAAVTVIATFCNGIIPAFVTIHLHKKDNIPVKCMKSDVDITILEGGKVLVSAWIENIGNTPFDTYVSNIYIDKGRETCLDKRIVFYDFPELLNHKDKGNSQDCILCMKCIDDDLSYPRKEEICQEFDYKYEDFRYSKVLKHLSKESIQFILPGERFSEDMVIQLAGGVYRVTLIVTTKTKGCECSCSTKQFFVPEHDECMTVVNK